MQDKQNPNALLKSNVFQESFLYFPLCTWHRGKGWQDALGTRSQILQIKNTFLKWDYPELGNGGPEQCPTGRVFQYRVGSGIGKNTGQRVGFRSGRSVEISIGYFRVSFLLSGNTNSGYLGYIRVIPGIPGNSQIICSPKHRVIPETSGNTRNFGYYPKFRVIPDISGYPLPEDFQN